MVRLCLFFGVEILNDDDDLVIDLACHEPLPIGGADCADADDDEDESFLFVGENISGN